MLFDLDDTLIVGGSVKRYAAAFVKRYSTWLPGVTVDYLFPAMSRLDAEAFAQGRDFHVHLRDNLPWTHVPEKEQLADFYAEAFLPEIKLLPDVKATLRALRSRGLRLGIVTNGGPALQRTKIERTGLESYVDLVIVSGELGAHKPDQRIYRLAQEGIGVDFQDIWFVGDHPVDDVLGPQGMGMAGIWRQAGELEWPPEVNGRPDAVVREVVDLLALLP